MLHNAMGCQMSRQKAFEGELFNVLKIALREHSSLDFVNFALKM